MIEIDDYLPRHLTLELRDALASARVVNLVGPRQVGKTTLVRDLFDKGRFLTLDDAAFLAAMDADPEGQLMSLAEDQNTTPIIIDEAQRSRKLALAIKKIVDSDRRKGQFVLTGSSKFSPLPRSRTHWQAECGHSSFGRCPWPRLTARL